MRWLHFKVREEAGVNLFLVHSFEGCELVHYKHDTQDQAPALRSMTFITSAISLQRR